MKTLFVGYGRMGGALGQAWRAAGLVSAVDVLDPHLAGVRPVADAAALPDHGYALIVVAVKPALAADALAPLTARHLRGATVLSVMAGVPIATLAGMLAAPCDIVRAMPNTAVMVGRGCTGLYAAPALDAARRQRVQALFDAVGTAHWVETEHQLHAVTALSGSGPAYYHLFSEALAQAGIALGLDAALARALAAQTALGAAHQQVADHDFDALRAAVTSPNGTTQAAIETLETHGALRALVATAAAAAHARSIALAGG